MDWRRNHLSLLIIPIKALLMMAVLKSVCEFFPCVYDSVNWTNFLKYLFPLLLHHHKKKKKKPQTSQSSTTNTKQTPQSLPAWIKKVLLRQLQCSSAHTCPCNPVKCIWRCWHSWLVSLQRYYIWRILKDYEDWKGSLLTGKKANGTPILKKDQKDNSGKAVNWP